ncbi:hypothetical protein EWM64_g8737 [Hericium alpestre]|uniref:Uncharacterized protein n=1 Tax=Hericium alpestre TaxID=135208 RepID=A0A4Y9ZKY4_9AGAM|nr:hypothetical protein EWM64_g8737 [Hericium alpestre]
MGSRSARQRPSSSAMARRMPLCSGSPFKTYVPPGDCVVVLRAIPPHLYATPHLQVWKRPLQERQRTASCLSAEVQADAAEEEPVVDGAG